MYIRNFTIFLLSHNFYTHLKIFRDYIYFKGLYPTQMTLSQLIAFPFFFLLLSIALGPLLFEKFWNKYYPIFIAILSSLVILFYIFHQKSISPIILSSVEFFQFISLILALYVVTSGIFIDINLDPTPKNNILFLIFGAIISNFIGTTGASMLLIRPFLKMNEEKLRVYHVIFFIFIISNVGGALTPIGDPPLFIGFLKGIPFFWTVVHNFMPWGVVLALLCGAFYLFDSKNTAPIQKHSDPSKPVIKLHGGKNVIFIVMIILGVFINPIVFPTLPVFVYHGHEISYIREIIFLVVTILAFFLTDKNILHKNNFNWEPIKELAILFFGIFITMTPVLSILGQKIQNIDTNLLSPASLYWATGTLSSFLDNAPTYLNFLTISMSSLHLDVSNVHDVIAYARGDFPNSINNLKAISIGSVFFGAMTYIGNGPNLMVKAIAEKKIKMPTFFKYITNYSFRILLPILFICWILFC